MCVPSDMVFDNKLTRSKMLQIVKYVVESSSSCSQAKHVGVLSCPRSVAELLTLKCLVLFTNP